MMNKIREMKEAGDSKDQICGYLMQNGVKYGKVQAFLKDAGLTFRRTKGTTWRDVAADAFIENPNLSEDEMLEAIKGSTADDAYYVKTWHHIFAKIAQGVASKA